MTKDQNYNKLKWNGMNLACCLANLLVLEPMTTKCMFERHVLERKLGTGHEIG